MNKGIYAINLSEVSKDLNLRQSYCQRDPSFDEKLTIEEKKLEERAKILNSFSWGAVQSIFNVVPLEFDFNINIASIENNFNHNVNHTGNKIEQTAEQENLSNWHKSQNGETAKTQILASHSPQTMEQNIILNDLLSSNDYFIGDLQIFMPFNKIAEAIKTESMSKLDLDPIIESISKHIKLIKAGGKTTIELALKPEYLGKLLLNISSKNGIVSIEIIASKETKEIMEKNLSTLKQALSQANINIGNLEVSTKGSSEDRENLSFQPVAFLNFGSTSKVLEQNKIEDRSLERLFTLLNELRIYSKV